MKSFVDPTSRWYRFGKRMHQFRWFILIVTLLIAFTLTFFSQYLPSRLAGDGFRTDGDYVYTQKILETEFKQSQNSVIIVLNKKDGATKQQFTSEVERMVTFLDKEKNVESFRHPLIDPSMKKDDVAYMTLQYEKGNGKLEDLNNALAEKVQKKSNDVVDVGATGFTIISDEMNKRSSEDLKKAELIGIPIAFLILLFAFGSVVASIIPIVLGVLSILTTFGILSFIAEELELSVFVLNVAPMIGLALSIDFALLYINRFKEEIQKKSVADAIATAYQTAGRAIIFSGMCVFIGLSALFVIEIDLFQSVAISGAIVVGVAIFYALTLLPAVLAVVGKKLTIGTISFISNRDDTTRETVWRKFANIVMKRPFFTAMGALVLLILFLLPVRDVTLNIPTVDALPESSVARQTYETFEKEFQTDMVNHASTTLVVELPKKATELESLKKAEGIVKQLNEDPFVYKVRSIYDTTNLTSEQLFATLNTEVKPSQLQGVASAFIVDNKMLMTVYLDAEPKASEAKEWARDKTEAFNERNDVKVTLGGQVKFEQELYDEITSNIVKGLSIILISTFVILAFAFRSIIIPIKAIIMNILSLGATFGIVTWLFQGGHFGLPESYIMLILPVFIFGLVFGLSMDYEVFLLSRIQEIYEETGDNEYATKEGLVSTSRIITSAAAIMIVVTGAFAFTDLVPVKQMGIGIAVAIFLDATIVRLLLVPSLMKMLGDWNWWYPFKKKVVEKQQL